MAQGVDDAHALLRVERQAALEEVDRERVGVRVERLERLLLLERQRAQVVAAALRADGVKVVERRRAEDAEDERELVVVCGTKCTSGRVVRQEKKGEKRTVATREERFAVEHLGEDAADGPCERQQSQRFNRLREVRGRADAQTSMANVYSLNLREGDEESAMEGEDARRDDAREHDLGRAVPPRRDILGHEARLAAVGLGREDAAREAKVAHLEVAVGVEQEVGRLEVAVDDVGRVHGLEGAQGPAGEEVGRERGGSCAKSERVEHALVDEVLDAALVGGSAGAPSRARERHALVVRERLGADDAVQVRLHELLD